MHNLEQLKEKEKLKKEMSNLEREVNDYKEELKNLLSEIKKQKKDEIKEKIFDNFESFIYKKDKSLKVEKRESSIQVIYNEDITLIKLDIIDNNFGGKEILKLKLEIDRKAYDISAEIYIPHYKPTSTRTVFTTSDDGEIIEMRKKINALLDEKEILERTTNYLENLQASQILYSIEGINKKFSSFSDLLEHLIL